MPSEYQPEALMKREHMHHAHDGIYSHKCLLKARAASSTAVIALTIGDP